MVRHIRGLSDGAVFTGVRPVKPGDDSELRIFIRAGPTLLDTPLPLIEEPVLLQLFA